MKRLILPLIFALLFTSFILVSCNKEQNETETLGAQTQEETKEETTTTTKKGPDVSWQAAPTTTTTKPTTTTKATAPTKKVIATKTPVAPTTTTEAPAVTTKRPTPPVAETPEDETTTDNNVIDELPPVIANGDETQTEQSPDNGQQNDNSLENNPF